MNALACSGKISLPIQQQDLYTNIQESYLYIAEKVNKANVNAQPVDTKLLTKPLHISSKRFGVNSDKFDQ